MFKKIKKRIKKHDDFSATFRSEAILEAIDEHLKTVRMCS